MSACFSEVSASARLTSLAWLMRTRSDQRVEDLLQHRVHLVDIVVLEIVGRVHQQAKARMVDLGEHPHRLLDRAHHVVDIGLEQEHRAVVVGDLRQLADHLAAVGEAFLGLVLRVMHPVRIGVERAGLGDDVGRAEVPGVADDRLELVEPPLALGWVGMDDVGVAGNAADRQVVVAEGLAHALGLLDRDRFRRREVDVLEVQVELHGVEAQAPDLLRRLVQRVGEVAGEDPDLQHVVLPDCQ